MTTSLPLAVIPATLQSLASSGGGGKVSVLLAMPAAQGLFHRAIIQSGAAIRVSTRERANALAEAALNQLGLRASECERLQTLPTERILAAIGPASRAVGRSHWPLLDRYDFGPVVDGADLPQHPAEPDAPTIADHVPLMVGGTKEESAFFLADDDAVWNRTLGEAELRQRIAAVAGAETDGLLAVYNEAMPQASPADRLIAALTGSNFWVRTVLLAERYSARAGRGPVYTYSLDWQSPAHGGRLKAHHAMDLPFVFDNVDIPDTTAAARGARELASRIADTWIAFARHGQPDNPSIPGLARLHVGRSRDHGLRQRVPGRPRPRPRRPPPVDPNRHTRLITRQPVCRCEERRQPGRLLSLTAGWKGPPSKAIAGGRFAVISVATEVCAEIVAAGD